MELPYVADDASVSALARVGRTEDIQFSPDNRRIAIAGANEDRILILSVDVDAVREGGPVKLKAPLELTCEALRFPHGLFWLDDRTLAVANRNGLAVMLDVPEQTGEARQVEITASLVIGEEPIDRIVTPGSVAAHWLFDDLHEVLICNNYAHYITRHLVKLGDGPRVLGSQVLLQQGLDIPDGLAFGQGGKWIAVSNHSSHCVHLYRNSRDLGPSCPPDGRLLGSLYPHGLRFSRDGRHIFLADAGAPFVHVYHSEDGHWAGDREPAISLRVIDEDTFRRGQTNAQEGGPKGIDICGQSQILVASCEHQPIVFYRLDRAMAELGATSGSTVPAAAHDIEADFLKTVLFRELERARQDGNGIQSALMESRSALATHQEAHHALSESHHALSQSHHALAQSHHALAQQLKAQTSHPWREVVLPECQRIFRSVLSAAWRIGGSRKSG